MRVKAMDEKDAFISKEFVLNVVNVNEAPEDIQISNNVLTDDTSVDTVIGNLSAIDPDYSLSDRLSKELTWTLIDPERHFKINKGNLIFIKTFEKKEDFSYTLTVICADAVDPHLSTSKVIAIQYRYNNVPPGNLSVDIISLYENITVNSTVGKITAIDSNGNQISFIDMSSEGFKSTFHIAASKCTSIVDAKGMLGQQCEADIGKFNFPWFVSPNFTK